MKITIIIIEWDSDQWVKIPSLRFWFIIHHLFIHLGLSKGQNKSKLESFMRVLNLWIINLQRGYKLMVVTHQVPLTVILINKLLDKMRWGLILWIFLWNNWREATRPLVPRKRESTNWKSRINSITKGSNKWRMLLNPSIARILPSNLPLPRKFLMVLILPL